MPLTVHEQSDEVKSLALEWAVLEALMGGTPAMRQAGKNYLPQWPNEEPLSYAARLSTATLFPAYRRTVSVMSGKPFAKELTLSDDTPASIKTWAEDIDRQGVSLHAFAAEMFSETVGYGLAGVLVDYPDTTPRDDKGKPVDGPLPVRTVAQVEASGARPYFVRVMHSQILGWRSEVRAGSMRLTQLRLLETAEEPDGEYGTKCVKQVRVLFPGGWQLWREPADKLRQDWELFDEGRTTLTEIPFVPFYGARDGFMVGKPALIDLAYLNVKHWQSQSDQDTILHVARVPILAMIGAEDETALTVGAMAAVKLPLGSEMMFVEHTGAAIAAGATSLTDLQNQMIETGAELLTKRPGQRTATEDLNDAEGNKCDLQRMVEGYENALDQALQFMADFANLPKGGKVSLFKDFGAATLSDASALLVQSLQQSGLLSKETALQEFIRRGVLSPDIDVQEELDKAAADGPPPGALADGIDPMTGKPLPSAKNGSISA
jgi:hypothetical protein